MKRSLEDSDDEASDRFLENEEDETQARKKRRGLIEKKRRDRINRCLTELRRLVPAAVDKQGSAKLEKAEILQLTVEHLRNLRNVAKHERVPRSSVNLHAAGYHECLNQVTNYLETFKEPEYKEEYKGQVLSNLNTTIYPQQARSPRVCPGAWPLPRGLGTSDRTLLQQTNDKPSINVPGVALAPEHKQFPLNYSLIPVNTLRMVGYPYVSR